MNFRNVALLFVLGFGISACGQTTGVGTSGGSGGGGSGSSASSCNPCRIFSSSTTSGGNFGTAAAADAICNADASKPNSSTYKALVRTSVRVPPSTDWPIRSGVAYVRADGTTAIASGNSDGGFTTPLTNSIITAANTYHWTGIDSTNHPVLDAHPNNCTNWTSNSNGVNGATGTGTITASGAYIGQPTAGGRPCDGSNRFYCVEQ